MPITCIPYTVAPYTAGASTYTTTGSNVYTVPATAGGAAVSGVYLHILGRAGETGHNPGGGGAFVSGFYSCSPGTKLLYVVGATGFNKSLPYGGGGGGQAGGFSGVFLSNAGGIAQSNAIAIAGGGGGGGLFGFGNGGGGGYPSGSSGTEGNLYGTISGGSQTAGGVGGASGAALLGGQGGGQPGGGGWYGGGSGISYTPDGTFPERPAGCGGSSYIGNVNGATGGIGLTSGAAYEQGYTSGVINTYAGSTSPYYVNATTAFVVIVPATIQTPTGITSRIPLSLVSYPTKNILTYTGNYISYTVPSGATSIFFNMWGAGGPGGSGGQPGGGGAYLTGTLAASPGEQLRIIVGCGGLYGSATYSNTAPDYQGAGGGGGGLAGQGGLGGGRSAIQKYIAGSWTEVVTAGGGGSAGGNAGTYGGNAYYTGTSQSAGTTYSQGRIPTGGSASAGGLGTFTANVGAPWDGTQFTGGAASNAFNVSPVTGACGGGGGGGGYYGGGGGGRSGADTYGGGGGSSYYNATYVTNFSGSNGNGTTQVATSIPGYVTGCGVGGAGGSTNSGSNGLVIFTLTYNKKPTLALPFISATNATNSANGTYTIISFTYPGGTLVLSKSVTATFLIVGGGGGGGSGGQTGGGGAGGAVYVSTPTVIPTGSYPVVVGAGGVAHTNGSNSTFYGYTGYGGGGGGNWINGGGLSGGCGGGGSGEGGAGAAGTQGFRGGDGRSQNTAGGGGGGMGVAGSTPNGGNGLQYNITGSNIYYAGGGQGGGSSGTPGLGGGGASGVQGTNGLGGGGGGGNTGGTGGSGVVIVSYIIN